MKPLAPPSSASEGMLPIAPADLTRVLQGIDHLATGMPPEVATLAAQILAQATAQGQAISPLQAGWAASQVVLASPSSPLLETSSAPEEGLAACRRLPTVQDLPLNANEVALVRQGRRRFWGEHGILGWGSRALLSGALLGSLGWLSTLMGERFAQISLTQPLGAVAMGLLPLGVVVIWAKVLGMVWGLWQDDPLEVPSAHAQRCQAVYRERVARLTSGELEWLLASGPNPHRAERKCWPILFAMRQDGPLVFPTRKRDLSGSTSGFT